MKNLILLLATVMLFGFTGCMEKMPNTLPEEETSGTIADLKVPADFDWKMTANVACNITATKTAKIFISETASAEPFATFFAGNGVDPLTLTIPSAAKTLYVQYETPTGKSAAQKIAVVNNAISYQVGADAKAYTQTAATRAAGEDIIYIPTKGWGTYLFEDFWPQRGDYDFNDLAVNYKIQLYITPSNKVEAMMIGVRVKAVGGIFPYDLYLRLMKVSDAQIGELVPYNAKNTSKLAEIRQIQNKDLSQEQTLLHFVDVKNNKNKPAGSNYLNTEKGFEISDEEMVEIAAVIYFSEPIAKSEVEADNFDFFLGQEKGEAFTKEIHLCNFAPINRAAYDEAVSETTTPDFFYKSAENLVWAINIPTDIKHAYEKTDFLKAYPSFADWAQSGGLNNQDWYKQGVAEHLVK